MQIDVDPLKLTNVSMALTAASLPLATLPFLVLMNDPHYVGTHRNAPVTNAVVLVIVALAFVLAVISLPLDIVGG